MMMAEVVRLGTQPALPVIANEQAEAALLGGLMYDNRAFERVADLVEADDFYLPAHSKIFVAIAREVGLGRIASPVTLKPYFENDPDFSELGGAGYLAQLTGSGVVLIAHRDLALQVRELAQRRRLRDSLQALAVGDWDKPFNEIVAEAEGAIAEAGRETEDGMVEVQIGEAADRALKAAEDDSARLLSGIPPVDAVLGKLAPRDLTIVAGRPGMGKSVLASNYGRGAAERGHGVVLFSLEMSAEQIAARVLSEMTFQPGERAVPLDKVLASKKDRVDIRRLVEARDRMERLPLYIVDAAALTVAKLNTLVRRWKRRMAARGQRLELVIVDYLQLMHPDFRVRGGDRVEAITYISNGLKRIAKQNDVHMMALSQLSRQVEQREDKRPHLADLRDSGSIEQDADNALFLYRPEYYLALNEPPLGDAKREAHEALLAAARNRIEFIAAKVRMGQSGKSYGKFYGPFQAMREAPLDAN